MNSSSSWLTTASGSPARPDPTSYSMQHSKESSAWDPIAAQSQPTCSSTTGLARTTRHMPSPRNLHLQNLHAAISKPMDPPLQRTLPHGQACPSVRHEPHGNPSRINSLK